MGGNLHTGCVIFLLLVINSTAMEESTMKEISPSKLDDVGVDRFSFSHGLLDSITYTFCTIGILLNFFSYSILNRKATMGVLLIKLVLLADGFVCVFYMLNQIWIDITLTYLLNVMFNEFMTKKPWLQNISIGLRTVAVATVSVSNWYIVCMIGHRCLSIYSNPTRGRFSKSVWVFVQKQSNLRVAFLFCWIFSLMQVYLTLHDYPLILDVLTFVLPLMLVFLFSIVLLIGLRAIQRTEIGTTSADENKAYLCCVVRHSPAVDVKGDSEETFAKTKIHPAEMRTMEKHPSYSAHRVNSTENQHAVRAMENELLLNSVSNANMEARINVESAMLRHQRIYSRITLTILSLAVSFLILDSFQFADLLIRVPWNNILGNLESQHRNNNTDTTGNSTVDSLLKEVQLSGEKQSVLSIVKNTCTLGKTLTNFLILCAHSLHFRSMLFSQFKRTRRFFRGLRQRCRPQLLRKARQEHTHFKPQKCCSHCSSKKRVRWCDNRDGVVEKPIRRCGCNQNLPEMYLDCDFVQVHEALPRKKHQWTFFKSRKDNDSGYVVHKLHRSRRHAHHVKSGYQSSVFPWRSRQDNVRGKQPLSWNQGMIFYKPPQNLFVAVEAGGKQKQLTGTEETLKNGRRFRISDITFSSGNSSSNIAKCLCSSFSGNTSAGGYPTCPEGTENSTSCCTLCVCQSLSLTNGKSCPEVELPKK